MRTLCLLCLANFMLLLRVPHTGYNCHVWSLAAMCQVGRGEKWFMFSAQSRNNILPSGSYNFKPQIVSRFGRFPFRVGNKQRGWRLCGLH